MLKVQSLGHLDQAIFVKGTILTQRPINGTSKTCTGVVQSDIAGQVGLIEEGEDRIALFEASDAGTGGYNSASAIGGRDSGKGDWEGVFAL